MPEEKVETESDALIDPIGEMPDFNKTESRMALAGHPIHAMSVAFPVALTFCTLGADVFYWITGDLFWARAAGRISSSRSRCGRSRGANCGHRLSDYEAAVLPLGCFCRG